MSSPSICCPRLVRERSQDRARQRWPEGNVIPVQAALSLAERYGYPHPCQGGEGCSEFWLEGAPVRPRSENGLESSRRPGTAKRFEPWPHGCPVRNVRFTGQSFNGRPIRTWTARLASNPEWESEVGVGPLGDVFPVRQVVPVLPARFDDVSMAAVVGERPPEADRKPASVRGSDGPGDRRYRVLEAPWRSGEILPVVADSRPKNIVHATESTRDVGTLCGRTSPPSTPHCGRGPGHVPCIIQVLPGPRHCSGGLAGPPHYGRSSSTAAAMDRA